MNNHKSIEGILMAMLALAPISMKADIRPFSNHWSFSRDSIAAAESPRFDDSGWMTVDLPHDFSMMPIEGDDTNTHVGAFTTASPGGNHTGHVMGGTGWYRKSFTVDKADSGKCFTLMFDGCYMETTVWVNGKKAGEHFNGYTPFNIDITSLLNAPGKKNVIAVRVDNPGSNSRWYSGSGIYRDVNLAVDEVPHVKPWGVEVENRGIDGNCNFAITLTNAGKKDVNDKIMYVRVCNQEGVIVAEGEQTVSVKAGSDAQFTQSLTISNPHLWDISDPYLYKAEVTLGTSNDAYIQPFGIRTLEFSPERGLLLNGKGVKLRGGCVHHDNGFLGASAIERAEYHRVMLLKQNGYNAVRCSHNPPSEAFLRACDELGMLVLDEFTDMWNIGKTPMDYSRHFDECWEQDLTSMMLRDRNHPSIIMWSIGNEIPKDSIEAGVEIEKMLVAKVKSLDSTRPVTEAVPSFLIHGGWKNTSNYFAQVDVAGYNYMNKKYESDHAQYPQRIIFGSETYPKDVWTEWNMMETHPYVLGEFEWTALDYIGEVSVASAKYVDNIDTRSMQDRDGIPMGTDPRKVFKMMEMYAQPTWPAYLSWCGDIDIIGNKKPQSLYRDVVWDQSPIEMNVHEPIPEGKYEQTSGWGWPQELPSWNSTAQEGTPLQVRVFTKAPEVRLYLNGKLVGEETVADSAHFISTFTVPYKPGTLTAVAMNNGQEIAHKTLTTTGEAVALRLAADRQIIKASRKELAYIDIAATDSEGNIVDIATDDVEISVEGEGEIVASGNADPMGMKSANRRKMQLFRGHAQVIVRPFENAGSIILHVISKTLGEKDLKINTVD